LNNVTSTTKGSCGESVQPSELATAPVVYDRSKALAASWQRSEQHGLRRNDRVLFNTDISRAVSKRLDEENRGLLEQAKPEMVRLYEGLGCARWVALCTNPLGQIVGFTGNRSSAPTEIRVLMVPGRSLLEAQLGTNAPACALAEKRFVVVERDEHFLTELGHFYCASAPILYPDGQLAGALDITGVDVKTLGLASDMVGLSVRRIENGFLAAIPGCYLLGFHSDEGLLDTPFEAALAVDESSVIRGANRAARQLLSLGTDYSIGSTLDSVFEHGLEDVQRKLATRSEPCIRLRSERGAFWFRQIDSDRTRAPRNRNRPAHISQTQDQDQFLRENPALQPDFEKAVRITGNGLSIILQGESGTGKEVFATALHRATRGDGPFVAINCAAIPEGLIEAELFGYADGAFTGGRKGGAIGKIEQAHKGTLLLDEIGDMSLPLQSRLLRVLQQRTVSRIGDSKEIPVEMSVVCATHRDLDSLIKAGTFRHDLYYRLNGYVVSLPPLRERSDRLTVIEGLLAKWSGERGAGEFLTQRALELLMNFPWPGNIRQLEQTIRAILALRLEDSLIDVGDLPAEIRRGAGSDDIRAESDSERTLESAERSVICAALSQHDSNLSATARALKISRGTLYGKLKKLGLRD
jgi:sigma-54 dependent transcriptional regulator, acetoin dehydrogenase operon transcriptional activator AcoR